MYICTCLQLEDYSGNFVKIEGRKFMLTSNLNISLLLLAPLIFFFLDWKKIKKNKKLLTKSAQEL